MGREFQILLMDKREDVTSFSSLYEIKNRYKGLKVGHAGTLDKFASGLMIVMVGGATKLNPIFNSFDKSYLASLVFGAETDTLDREGKVVETSNYIPEKEEVISVLNSFIGKQKQVPPVYSAIHVDGKRAYKEARKNKEIDMPERDVEIYDMSFVDYTEERLTFKVSVSKGTYIRSLARDIALSLNTRAHLVSLRRLSIGPYTLSDIGKDTSFLIEKSGLFGNLYFPEIYRKEIENGTIKREWITSSSGEEKSYFRLFIGGELFAYASGGDKIRIMARVE